MKNLRTFLKGKAMTKTPEELTKAWKAGKLVQGWYFCKLKNGLIHHFEFNGNDFTDLTCHIPPVAKILAPCNYDEYMAMQAELDEFKRSVTSYIGKPIDYDIACETVNKLLDDKKKLKKELAEHRENCCCLENEKLRLDKAKLEEENNKLRDLLNECVAHLSFGEIGTSVTPLNILLTRINIAIGESEE